MIRIVIADDEQLVRTSVQIALTQINAKTEVVGQASNGKEALEQVQKLKPDILITDIKMPLMSGLELIKQLRRENEELSIIIISGFADFNYAKEAIRYGVTGYILKPIKTQDMQEAIDQILRDRGRSIPVDVPLPTQADRRDSGAEILSYIRENYAKDISLLTLSLKFNFNQKYLSSLIKTKTGKSFTELILELRINKAIELIKSTDLSIKEISVLVGYVDHQYFHRVFKKYTGKTPLEIKTSNF